MSAPGPQPSPQQIAQMQAQFLEEAKRRGLTPQQFQEQQRQQLAAEAAKQGLSIEQYVTQLKARAMQEHAMRQQQAQAQGQQNPQQGQVIQQIPVSPNAEKKPEAVAVAKFLRSQDLKTRVCILDGQRKDMFKGKRLVPHCIR
jgi:translocation protein SEC62